jgi:hypothetical protein
VSWALRSIGRRSPPCAPPRSPAALADSPELAARGWVGQDALRDLAKARRASAALGAVKWRQLRVGVWTSANDCVDIKRMP